MLDGLDLGDHLDMAQLNLSFLIKKLEKLSCSEILPYAIKFFMSFRSYLPQGFFLDSVRIPTMKLFINPQSC